MRTIIIGGTRREALQFCKDARIAPHAKSTIILTTPEDVRGLTISPEDTTVWNGVVSLELQRELEIAIDAGTYADKWTADL